MISMRLVTRKERNQLWIKLMILSVMADCHGNTNAVVFSYHYIGGGVFLMGLFWIFLKKNISISSFLLFRLNS